MLLNKNGGLSDALRRGARRETRFPVVESNENDLGSERRPQTSVNNSGTPQTSVQMDMNNLKTSNLYKYYKSIDSIK